MELPVFLTVGVLIDSQTWPKITTRMISTGTRSAFARVAITMGIIPFVLKILK